MIRRFMLATAFMVVLLPSTVEPGSVSAQPAAQTQLGISELEQFAPTGVRQMLSGIRIFKGASGRNQVYRDADAVKRDLTAYYDTRIAKAGEQLVNRDQLGLEPSQVRAYQRVKARLEAERELAIGAGGVVEDEKKAAKFGFESTLKNELLAAIVRTPKAQQGLAQVRGAVDDLQGAFKQVQTALEGGNPLSAVMSDVESKLERVEKFAGFVTVVHGEAGAKIGGLAQRVRTAIEKVREPAGQGLEAATQVVEDLDSAAKELENQVTVKRSIRADPAVVDTAKSAIRELFAPASRTPAEEIIAEAAAQGFNRAAVRSVGIATGGLDPSELRRMRDRVQAAILGNTLERVAGICGRLTGALRRAQSAAAAEGRPVPSNSTPCTLFGNVEALQAFLDANRDDAETDQAPPNSDAAVDTSEDESAAIEDGVYTGELDLVGFYSGIIPEIGAGLTVSDNVWSIVAESGIVQSVSGTLHASTPNIPFADSPDSTWCSSESDWTLTATAEDFAVSGNSASADNQLTSVGTSTCDDGIIDDVDQMLQAPITVTFEGNSATMVFEIADEGISGSMTAELTRQ